MPTSASQVRIVYQLSLLGLGCTVLTTVIINAQLAGLACLGVLAFFMWHAFGTRELIRTEFARHTGVKFPTTWERLWELIFLRSFTANDAERAVGEYWEKVEDQASLIIQRAWRQVVGGGRSSSRSPDHASASPDATTSGWMWKSSSASGPQAGSLELDLRSSRPKLFRRWWVLGGGYLECHTTRADATSGAAPKLTVALAHYIVSRHRDADGLPMLALLPKDAAAAVDTDDDDGAVRRRPSEPMRSWWLQGDSKEGTERWYSRLIAATGDAPPVAKTPTKTTKSPKSVSLAV